MARSLGHYISASITLAMMIFVVGYTAYKSMDRKGTHWNKYGPTYFVVVASFFIMADLVRHVLQDVGWWPSGQWPGSNEYLPNCPNENMSCLSPIGWIFTVFFTYSGFFLLFVGTMWNANIIGKLKAIRQKWRLLRKT